MQLAEFGIGRHLDTPPHRWLHVLERDLDLIHVHLVNPPAGRYTAIALSVAVR